MTNSAKPEGSPSGDASGSLPSASASGATQSTARPMFAVEFGAAWRPYGDGWFVTDEQAAAAAGFTELPRPAIHVGDTARVIYPDGSTEVMRWIDGQTWERVEEGRP